MLDGGDQHRDRLLRNPLMLGHTKKEEEAQASTSQKGDKY